ncbi:MAG: ion transporter [Eubacteriales bacterium]
MREWLFHVIMPSKKDKPNVWSKVYDTFMIITIILSLIPMFFKETNDFFHTLELITVTIFIFDYLLRWSTADLLYNEKSLHSYMKYPFSFMALIDLFSILSAVTVTNSSLKILKTLRITRSVRVIRIFKSLRYSKNFTIIIKVVRKTRESLSAVAILCVMYVMASALVVFNIEPDTFTSYFDAFYWATVSLTTVGYGDIYPVSTAGRIVTMLSSVFGVAVVALPAGIITAGFMSEIEKNK